MERKWSIRAYREGDEEGILELWKVIYPEREYDQEHWVRWWRWMYRENPAGAGKIWVAEHEGRIVGQSAIIPVMIKIGIEAIAVFQSIDTMTHPEYRRQGIYETLAKAAYAEAAKENVRVGYRFPNKFSHPIAIKKLDWFDVATTRMIFKPLHWEHALKLKISNKFLLKFFAIGGKLVDRIFCRAKESPNVEGLAVTQVSRFDGRIDEFWDRVSSQYPIMVVRNKDYLNWRYVAVPDLDYTIYIAEKEGEINGYLVLRCMQRQQTKVGVIFDIVAQSEEIAHCLISKAMEHCAQEKTDLVYCNMIANRTYQRVFKKNGFISIPFLKGAQFCAYSCSPHISKEFLKDPKNWLVQIGDSDMI